MRNFRDAKLKKGGSLFGCLNYCCTAMGQVLSYPLPLYSMHFFSWRILGTLLLSFDLSSLFSSATLLCNWPWSKLLENLQRLLWTSILQPLSSKTQLEAITNRLDFVELLIGNGDAFFELSQKLEKLPDLEFLVATCLVQIPKFGTQCGSAEKCQTLITKILGLKKAVCKVEEMHSALARLEDKSGNCLLLQLFREALKNPLIDEMRSKIDMVLDDAAGTSGNGVRFLRLLHHAIRSAYSVRNKLGRQHKFRGVSQ